MQRTGLIARRASLQQLGVPVTLHAYSGLAHTTDAAETRDLAAWLDAHVAQR